VEEKQNPPLPWCLPAEPAFAETLRAGRQVLWQAGERVGVRGKEENGMAKIEITKTELVWAGKYLRKNHK